METPLRRVDCLDCRFTSATIDLRGPRIIATRYSLFGSLIGEENPHGSVAGGGGDMSGEFINVSDASAEELDSIGGHEDL